MDRQSDKHSPRVDDQMEHEVRSMLQGAPVESRSDEDRFQEGPVPDTNTRPLPPPGDLTDEELDRRALLAASLRPSAFPTSKAALLAVAEDEHAPDEVLNWLRQLPDDRHWDTVEQVWEALGGPAESRKSRP
ncbi:MAG TPA: DUF2795 domain-containing protein [Acidimicrobiales bacterium]|jgi:hypothetical protein|nr:DUF2795 domain-containing protein [Acidimicrobiales bacterium]